MLNSLPALAEPGNGTTKFNVAPNVEQKLEDRLRNSSEFLQAINVIPVSEQEGAVLGVGVSRSMAGRTDTSGGARRNPTAIGGATEKHRYLCRKTDFDWSQRYAVIDAWAHRPEFQTLLRDDILAQQAEDRITIGFNGTSAAATTDRDANPLLEDVNEGWLHKIRTDAPAQVMAELESTFGCPVIESYGMTEAAHQMTSNQLPPGQRKPGSVGAAAGPEVAIMSPDGLLMQTGHGGEIVIRGPNVTAGYEKNPEANASAFAHGWFHTGDQGVLDEDGYLRVTGRLKEIINRGGEKISPLEVDDVLMDHPAVAQVVTFAMPHPKLGEDVAAAVVLREGLVVTEIEIRDFCSERLADFKVPRRVLILEEIPKGATGKLQRIGLAAKLGLA